MADEMLLSGQRVLPKRATTEGFAFAHPELDPALAHAISG
jgi:NAD dependent epimerase/dehydratase family enzyme